MVVSFLLFNLVGNERVLQMVLASRSQNSNPRSSNVLSHGRFCIVNLMPTRCHQSCLKDGH